MTIFIIPINLVLVSVLSTLVSINITLASYTFKNRAKNINNNNSCFSSGIGGAASGLFTAYPTCAGTFFSTIVGITTGTSTTTIMSSAAFVTIPIMLQVLFILISIAILIISSSYN